MGLFSHKIPIDELKAGDHIYSWRNAYIYSHHGSISFSLSLSLNGGRDKQCLDCGDQSNIGGGVISSCLDCFLSGGNLYLFEYSASPSFFLARRGGTCTIASSDPCEVISRAKFLLLRNGFGEYDLLDNSCEDFAIYCKTGLFVLSIATKFGSSGQANSVSASSGVVSLTLKVLGVKKKRNGQEEDSIASVANKILTSTVKYVVPGFGGMALAEHGNYCIVRLFYDIGVRKDACKVSVEELVAFVGAKQGRLESNKGR